MGGGHACVGFSLLKGFSEMKTRGSVLDFDWEGESEERTVIAYCGKGEGPRSS